MNSKEIQITFKDIEGNTYYMTEEELKDMCIELNEMHNYGWKIVEIA